MSVPENEFDGLWNVSVCVVIMILAVYDVDLLPLL